jgi:hypothetical protein
MIGKATFVFKSVVKLPHRYPFLKYFRYITIKNRLSTEIKQNKINTKQFSHS